jgi:hypothetical protein
LKTLFSVFFFFLIIAKSFSVVNYRNGNYYQEFVDLIITPELGAPLAFKRTYNSASDFEGLFGLGWGSTFETRAETLDNLITIKMSGNGRQLLFVPASADLAGILDSKLKELQKKYQLKDEAFASFKARLLNDPKALVQELGPLQSGVTQEGSYKSVLNDGLSIVVDRTKIDFMDEEGIVWSFDRQGNLKKWKHPTGLEFVASYKNGQLLSMGSSKYFFEFERTPQGAIKSLKVEGKNAKYQMDKGFLKKSVSQNGETFDYEYDKDRLVLIQGENFKEVISYLPATGEVMSVIDSNNKRIDYKFSSKLVPHEIRRAEVTGPEGTAIYEYEYRAGKDGNYLYRRSTTSQRAKQEVIFDDCCGRPLFVKDQTGTYELKYDEKGLPLSLKLPKEGEHAWLWNEKSQLVTYKSPTEVRTYSYDSYGPSEVVSSEKGTLKIKRGANNKVIEASFKDVSGKQKTYKFQHAPKGGLALVTDQGDKVFLKELEDGRWKVDNSRPSNAKAKLEMLSWLNNYQDLATPPLPQAFLPTF